MCHSDDSGSGVAQQGVARGVSRPSQIVVDTVEDPACDAGQQFGLSTRCIGSGQDAIGSQDEPFEEVGVIHQRGVLVKELVEKPDQHIGISQQELDDCLGGAVTQKTVGGGERPHQSDCGKPRDFLGWLLR